MSVAISCNQAIFVSLKQTNMTLSEYGGEFVVHRVYNCPSILLGERSFFTWGTQHSWPQGWPILLG